MLYYLTVTTGLFIENEEKGRLSLILQDRDGGRRKTGFMVHDLLSMHGDCSSCL